MAKIIPLTQGYEALVDDCDYEFLIKMGLWFAAWNGRNWYAARKENEKTILMHRVIMEKHDPGFKGNIDHIDTNELNNQYSNLRIATKSQNGANRGPQKNNTSGYKGVYWCKKRQKWETYVTYQNVRSHLGYFNTPEEAARVYDCAAWSLWEDYAKLNFPEDKNDPH